MNVRLATLAELDAYVELARTAQAWLRSQGLEQFVPAAPDENQASIRARVEGRSMS